MTRAPTNADVEKIVFRKVSVAINFDERYLALSPIPPCGRGLFQHLLTGPHTTGLPGLSLVGRARIAEELGWDQEDFDKAFAEILGQGLAKADWKLRVLWLPNGLKHNLPQSVNVVKSWKRLWGCIPDCELKAEAWGLMKDQLKAFGEPFGKAFMEACAKPSGKAPAMPSFKADESLSQSLGERSTDRVPLSREKGAGRTPTEKIPSQEQQPREVSSTPRARMRPAPRTREAAE